MSARKTPRGARRPSARRGTPTRPASQVPEPESGATKVSARAASKRVSARRGKARDTTKEAAAQGAPAAATNPRSQPDASPQAAPRRRARAKAKATTREAPVPAPEPAAETQAPRAAQRAMAAVSEAPTAAAAASDDGAAGTPRAASGLGDSTSDAVSLPSKPAVPAPKPSIGPPGVQVSEDVWETVGEGPPVLVELGAAASGVASAEPEPRTSATSGARTAHLTASSRVAGPREEDGLGSAQAVLGADYYYQQWGRGGLRRLEADVDGFGLDPHFEARMRPWLSHLCRYYFRVEVTGTANLPQDGRALLIANRSGVVPWDGLVLKEALRTSAPSLPALRWLAEDSVFYYPFLGVFMNRMGAVRACPENAERLLQQASLVAVFPEGARGAGKLFRERYQLQRFGRGGYVRLALRSRAPVIPVAIVGGEDAYPLLARSKLLGKLFGSNYAPVTPTFPLLGPAGLLPAPVKWRVVIGEPLDLSDYDPEAADDALVVHRVNERVRGNLQRLVTHSVHERGHALL